MPFCTYCGSQEPEEMAFCGSCGRSMTISPTTTRSNNILQKNTVAQTKNDLTHIVNMPESVSHQEPVSETEEESSATLTRQKVEPHNHDHRGHPSYQPRHWRRRYKHRMASYSGTALATNLILIVAIVAGVIVGTSKIVPYVFHLGSNSAIRHGTARKFPIPTAFGLGEITSGPDGNLWFTESTKTKIAVEIGAIGRITPSGVITEFLLPLGSGSSSPLGITSGPDGNLWFTEHLGNKIGRITPAGIITEFPVPIDPNGNNSPDEITSGPDGNLWFTENGGDNYLAGKIGRITPTGMITEFPIPTDPNGNDPLGITSGPDSNLWFTESRGKIGRITPAGVITEFPIPPAFLGGITSGPDGNLWFTEESYVVWPPTNKIGRITPAGVITEFPVPIDDNVCENSLTSGPDSNLWFAEFCGKIERITPAGVITEFPIPPDSSIGGITSGPDGNLWFTEDDGYDVGPPTNKIGRITP